MIEGTDIDLREPRKIKRTWIELECPDGITRVTMPMYPQIRIDDYTARFRNLQDSHALIHSCHCSVVYMSMEHEYE